MLNYSKKLDRKILIPILIILAVFFLATSMQTDFAATNTIDNTTNGGISGALNSSNAGDTIELDDGVYTGNNNTNMTINKNITIQGKTKDKAILDAQGLSGIYTIGNNLNVTFINITFINGNSSNGGAINNPSNGTTMTFINCTFTKNNANAGGAIRNVGANCIVIDSTFNGNNGNGGAIYNNGGVNFSVINSTFTNNNAIYSGGAIYNNGGVNFSVIGSNFTGNNAIIGGGAIENSGTNFFVIDSTFTGNNAGTSGGAIWNSGTNFSVLDSNFTGNNASIGGGAICNSGGVNFSVICSTFISNNVTSGGAIWNSGTNFSVIDSTFTGNNAAGGGAIANSGAYCTVIGSNFTENNINSTSGGAISNSGTNFSVVSSTFTGNNAIIAGGAILNVGANCTVIDSIFNSNNATSGGAIRNGGINFSVIGSNFTSNNASTGGAISNSGNMSISGNIMNDNTAGLGRMIYNSGNIGVLNLTFIGNSTKIVTFGQKLILFATLTDDMGNTVTGQNILFYLNGVFIKNVTSVEGYANFTYTVGILPSEVLLNGTYEGIGDYDIIINQGLLNIIKAATNSSIIVSNATVGKPTIVRGVLVDENGNIIAGAQIKVIIGGKSYNLVTGTDGRWNLSYTPSKVGNFIAKVYYNGDSNYLASNNSLTYSVSLGTDDPSKPNIRLVKRVNSRIIRHGNLVYMKWLTFKNLGASGSQTVSGKVIYKNFKYKLWKVYNKKLNYKYAANRIKFKISLKSGNTFKLKLKVYRPIKQK